jgi:hypothetical protein
MHVAVNGTPSARRRSGILVDDLFLEVLGAGRDEHRFALEDRRDEIREGLAGAGARFGEQHAAVFEHAGDGTRHLTLRGTGLEVGERRDERALRGEDLLDGAGEGRRLWADV